ncbi:membrane protein [Streptomyces aureocirculatus]|uniref:membrane protein n=1 Tax=Streptomyces aureocirculatus TaxID=67275 RepID=UPI0004C9D8B1|nr:membrane protein [Streptomyces aureocirculatus]
MSNKALSKAKGFRKSRTGTYLSIGTTAFGALSTLKQVKKARAENDALKLVDAVVSAAAIVTGIAILVRELRRIGDDDVLLG